MGKQYRAEIGEFLTSRRARITPKQVGLPVYDAAKRRVTGLRRQEVATLAGLSVDYYTQIERGKVNTVSEQVLDAIARALQLDEAEHSHLFDLHRSVTTSPQRPRHRRAKTLRPTVQRMLDAMTVPAFVRNARQDLVGGNQLAHAFYSPLYPDPLHPDPNHPVNFVRFCFLDPRAPEFYPDWEGMADNAVNLLRTDAGRDPYDRDISDLVGELSTRSEQFRTWWANHATTRRSRPGPDRLQPRTRHPLRRRHDPVSHLGHHPPRRGHSARDRARSQPAEHRPVDQRRSGVPTPNARLCSPVATCASPKLRP